MSQDTMNSKLMKACKQAVMDELEPMIETMLAESGEDLEACERLVRDVISRIGAVLLTHVLDKASSTPPVRTVACPCGNHARFLQLRPLTLITTVGKITVRRAYYRCAACGHGVTPRDRQWGVQAGGVSPLLHDGLARAGADHAFAHAAAEVERYWGVKVAPTSVQTACMERAHAIQTDDAAAEAVALATGAPSAEAPPAAMKQGEVLCVSLDGTTVPTQHAWREAKLGAVYRVVQRTVTLKGVRMLVVQAKDISYVGGMVDAARFGRRLYAEAVRRGIAPGAVVVVLSDGSQWIRTLIAEHFPNAVLILDWFHAASYVAEAALLLFGQGADGKLSAPGQQWHDAQRDALWDGQVEAVIAEVAQQHKRLRRQAVRTRLAAIQHYFEHNRDRMDYPAYRARGWPMGSGVIESGAKHVIGQRLKDAGMHWSDEGAEAMIQLRCRLKSERWDSPLHTPSVPPRPYQRTAMAMPGAATTPTTATPPPAGPVHAAPPKGRGRQREHEAFEVWKLTTAAQEAQRSLAEKEVGPYAKITKHQWNRMPASTAPPSHRSALMPTIQPFVAT